MNALPQFLQPLFTDAFSLWGAGFTWLELAACAMAVAMVILNMRVHPGAWPLAIASSMLYAALFWNSRLYGEAALQFVFAALAVWGWRQWRRAGPSAAAPPNLPVRHLTRRGLWASVFALALAWPAVASFLTAFTDSDVPWRDALPTAGSLIGQWLLGRKYVENWPAWVAVNAASVLLFAQKGLWLTTALYAVFFAMSFSGWRTWRRLALHPKAGA